MAHQPLEQYRKLTQFLGLALGVDYEVALHDLTDKSQSIIAIANGHISGRTVGAPLTNVALQAIAEGSYLHTDFRINYTGISARGQLLRSSTMYIKDARGALIGMLCINFDDSRYDELSQKVLALCHPDGFLTQHSPQEVAMDEMGERERFHNSIDAVAEGSVAQAVQEMGVPVGRMTQDEKMSVVGSLEARGVFLLKGAVKDVAEKLQCSQASVYRYLACVRRTGTEPAST